LGFSFLKDGALTYYTFFLAILSPPKVVFICSFTSIPSYNFTFDNGGSFVEDFAEISVSVVWIALIDVVAPIGALYVIG